MAESPSEQMGLGGSPSLPRPTLLRTAIAFYLALAGAALLWGLIAGRPRIWLAPSGSSWPLAALGSSLGITFGLLVAGATRLTSRMRWAQDLNRFFASILGRLRWREAALLAFLSGVGEELFFRGAMQPTVGLWISSTVFALVHLPPRRALLSWTALAWLLGLTFGWAFEATGNLAAPITAHFVINLFNLRHVSSFAPPPSPPRR